MKKFLTFLIVLIVVFTFGLVIFRLLRNEETLSIVATNAYYNEGEEVSFAYNHKNKNKSSKITVESSNPEVVKKLDNGTFKAVGGGTCQIILTHTNPKNVVTTLVKDVLVGAGTEENPYFIRSEEELLEIGRAESDKTLDKHYIQTVNITLTKDFVPIDGTLNGSYRGMLLDDSTSPTQKSYTKIINYSVKTTDEQAKEFSSIFRNISPTGKFGYINFENVNINGNFSNASVVCVKNEGLIDFVSVSGNITTTSNSTSTRIAGIAIENTFVKTNKAAQISRCSNSAVLTTAGNKIAGIVYKNTANVLFCINGGEKEIDGKLVANGLDIIAGGIVGENAYNFGDDLKNAMNANLENDEEKDALIADELEYRPQVKDCYSTSTLEATLSGTTFVGGIIGKEVQGYTTSNLSYNQLYDNITIGNYYLKRDDANFTRGVGNLPYTDESVINIYEPTTDFIAIGLEYSELTGGIDSEDPDKNPVKASLVSFLQNNVRVTWLDENVYWFYSINTINQLPLLSQTENYFGSLSYRIPTTTVKSTEIPDLKTFLAINFTQTTPSGRPREYTITNYIDFKDSINSANLDNYFAFTGKEGTPAKFILRANPVLDDNHTPLKDSNGNIVYYGFKNLDSTFKKNAKYAGIFGMIEDSIIENVSFTDCLAIGVNNGGEYPATEIMGLVAGSVTNSTLRNLSFNHSEEGNGNGIELGNLTRIAGGLVGEAISSNISNIQGTFGVMASSSDVVTSTIGGIVGKSENSNFNNISAETVVSVGPLNAGGFAGVLTNGEVNRIKLKTSVESNDASGFVNTLTGTKVSTVVLNSTLNATSTSAGIAINAENEAVFSNASIESEFKGGTSQVGLFATLSESASADHVIHTNNFNNSSGTFYAKTKNIAGQYFDGDTISDGMHNRESGAGKLINCLVLNKVENNVNYNHNRTIFYAEQNALINFGTQRDSFDPTARTVFTNLQFVTIFGKYGAGILNSHGKVYVEGTNASRFKSDANVGSNVANCGFGFSAEWNFDGFPTLNI